MSSVIEVEQVRLRRISLAKNYFYQPEKLCPTLFVLINIAQE
jgi:hypothetical protein